MLNFHKKIFAIFGLKYSKLKDSLASENDLKIKRKMDLWIEPLKLRRSLELRCNTAAGISTKLKERQRLFGRNT